MILRTGLFSLLAAIMLTAVAAGFGLSYAGRYDSRIYPGVHIGPIDVGDKSHTEAADLLSAATNSLLEGGLTVTAQNRSARIELMHRAMTDPDASVSLIQWKSDEAIDRAMKIGRDRSSIFSIIEPLFLRLTKPKIDYRPTLDESRLLAAISEAFSEFQSPPINASFLIRRTSYGWDIKTTDDQNGYLLNEEKILAQIKEPITERLMALPINVEIQPESAQITRTEAEEMIPIVQTALDQAPYRLIYSIEDSQDIWEVTADQLTDGLILKKEAGILSLTLDDETLDNIFSEITNKINVPAQDAKFKMENGRVVEFQGNRNGLAFNEEETRRTLEAALNDGQKMIEIMVDVTEPTIAMSDINDLGIREILGVGESNFLGSPKNRVSNIQNGARLLNGILIPPGETFSLLTALRPFTAENGYLPELVIKGNSIVPEIGGGLCQIGTTTFRAAMNAGLRIVERRNHSLVVRYYNDPANGNPGTDATIYEPSPDFQFLNDTGAFILFTTDVNAETGQLTFTLWGTSDGRRGSYSAPEISAWFAPGEKRVIETTDLAPGVEQCQSAFRGANASFTYTIIRPNGEKEEQIFTSSYRALPETCLIGVEKIEEATEETTTGEAVETSTILGEEQ